MGGLRSTFLLRDSSDDFRQRKRFRRLLVVAELLELCAPDSSPDSTSLADDDCPPLNSTVSAMSTRVHVNYSRFIPIIPVLGIHIVQMASLRERPRLPSYFLSIVSTFPIHVSWEPDQSYHVKMAAVVSLSW